MYGLIKELYSPNKQNSFKKLYDESSISDQFLLRSIVAESLKDCPRIISSHGEDWILCTLASHKKPESDTLRVFRALIRKFKKIEFGLLTDQITWKETNDIADSCLVGVGFFKQRMEILHQKHGAPSIKYYIKAGSLAFCRLGYEQLGKEFEEWTSYIEREFTI